MYLPVLAVPRDIDIIKNSGLSAAGCTIHKILDLFAVTLVEQRKALDSGNHVQRRASREPPSQLRRRAVKFAGSLLLFLPRVDSDEGDTAKDGRENDIG